MNLIIIFLRLFHVTHKQQQYLIARANTTAFRVRKGPRRRCRLFTRARCGHAGKRRRTEQPSARGSRKQTNARCANVIGSGKSDELGE